MKVQVVVPCINLWEKYTQPCLMSLIDATAVAKDHGIDVRVLLIDNASTDETKVRAGAMVSDWLAHKRNEEMWGFQKSVNFGVNDGFERGYDYVLVINNDVLMHKDSIWRLVKRFEDEKGQPPMWEVVHEPVDMVGNLGDIATAETPKKRELHLGMVTCMDVRGETTPENFQKMDSESKVEVGEAPHPNFSAFMVNKAMWDAVGEMDELFAPAYFEDNDLHYRMKLAGWRAIVNPPALFYHYGSRTQNEALSGPLVNGPAFEAARSRFVDKWGGVPGHERYTHPYNDKDKAITWTKQSHV